MNNRKIEKGKMPWYAAAGEFVPEKVTIDYILDLVAKQFGTTVEDLKAPPTDKDAPKKPSGNKRLGSDTESTGRRKIAAFLCWKYTLANVFEIGDALNVHHCTVSYYKSLQKMTAKHVEALNALDLTLSYHASVKLSERVQIKTSAEHTATALADSIRAGLPVFVQGIAERKAKAILKKLKGLGVPSDYKVHRYPSPFLKRLDNNILVVDTETKIVAGYVFTKKKD